MSVQVFEQQDDSVACYERDGTIVYLNPVACRVLGAPLDQLAGKNVWALVPSERGGAFYQAFMRVAETGIGERIEQESVVSRRFWIAQFMRVDGRVWITGRDASAKREAILRLEILASASRVFASAGVDGTDGFRTIAEHVGTVLGDLCSIRFVSKDGTVIEAPISLYDPDPAVVAALHDMPPVLVASQADGTLTTARSVLMNDADPGVIAARIARPGQEAVVRELGVHSAMIVPMRVDGQVVGFISVFRRNGRTKVPYTSSDLRLLEELADRAALVVNQWRTLRSLRQAVAMRDEFVSVASHELRTPLAALDLQLASLARAFDSIVDVNSSASTKVLRQITNAKRQVDRLTALTGMLLDVSRLTGAQIQLEREAFDLGELAREVAERFEAQAARASCTVTLHVDGELRGTWDRNRIDQILSNVLQNALKYGAARPVSITCRREAERVLAIVADQGIGIEPADRERIFRRFERAVSASNYGGLGLGLYIAHQLVLAHGGTITVDSEPGRGSAFTISLPA